MGYGKHGYVIFYVAFLAILLFFSAEMGTQIIQVSGSDSQLEPFEPPTSTGTLLDSLTFLFGLAVYAVGTFGTLVLVTTEFLLLFIFVVLPLTAGFVWAIVALARGGD